MVTRDIVLLQQNDLLCKSADVIRGSNLPEAYPIKIVSIDGYWISLYS